MLHELHEQRAVRGRLRVQHQLAMRARGRRRGSAVQHVQSLREQSHLLWRFLLRHHVHDRCSVRRHGVRERQRCLQLPNLAVCRPQLPGCRGDPRGKLRGRGLPRDSNGALRQLRLQRHLLLHELHGRFGMRAGGLLHQRRRRRWHLPTEERRRGDLHHGRRLCVERLSRRRLLQDGLPGRDRDAVRCDGLPEWQWRLPVPDVAMQPPDLQRGDGDAGLLLQQWDLPGR